MRRFTLRRVPDHFSAGFQRPMTNLDNISDLGGESAAPREPLTAAQEKSDWLRLWFETGGRLSFALGHEIFGNPAFEIIGVMLGRIDKMPSMPEADIAFYTRRNLPLVQRYISILEAAGYLMQDWNDDAAHGRAFRLTDHCLATIRGALTI